MSVRRSSRHPKPKKDPAYDYESHVDGVHVPDGKCDDDYVPKTRKKGLKVKARAKATISSSPATCDNVRSNKYMA